MLAASKFNRCSSWFFIIFQESKIEQQPEQTSLKVEAKKVQIPTSGKQPTTTPMPDARVRQLRDQLIRAKVYQGLGPLRSNPHFIRELRARIRDVQRVLGDATKDSELPKRYLLLPHTGHYTFYSVSRSVL